MGDFFNYDNKFFMAMSKLADCFYVSVLWVVFSLPVFTMGASSAALYQTARKVILNDEGYVFKTFTSEFKSNFKQCTKIWLIHIVLYAFLAVEAGLARNAIINGGGGYLGISYYLCLVFILVNFIWSVYTMTYTARFELNVKDTLKNGLLLIIGFLPWSALMIFIFIATMLILWFLPFFIILFPAFVGMLYSIILERIYKRFIDAE